MVVVKGVRDIATGTDIAVEDAIRASLTAAFDIPIVGEERGGQAPADGSAYWLIDPICGTTNFAWGTPLFCVNIALVERGNVTIAVVGDTTRGEISVAERGRGAWALKQGMLQALTCTATSEVIVLDDAASKGQRRAHAARFIAAAISADRWSYRSLGTTLALPYLAAGRVAAYGAFLATALHSAAGCLLVTEAGGVISDVFGNPWTLESDTLLSAATPELHSDLVGLSLASAHDAGSS